MEVYPNGTRIRTKIEGIEAITTAIVIRGEVPVYEISYFCHGDYKIATLSVDEFDVLSGEKQTIGFKNK